MVSNTIIKVKKDVLLGEFLKNNSKTGTSKEYQELLTRYKKQIDSAENEASTLGIKLDRAKGKGTPGVPSYYNTLREDNTKILKKRGLKTYQSFEDRAFNLATNQVNRKKKARNRIRVNKNTGKTAAFSKYL
jgi:tRNA A22 N-methylase